MTNVMTRVKFLVAGAITFIVGLLAGDITQAIGLKIDNALNVSVTNSFLQNGNILSILQIVFIMIGLALMLEAIIPALKSLMNLSGEVTSA